MALPTAQRHPIRLVLVAAAVGAVLVKTRAWRWLLKRSLFAGMVPLLVSTLIERIPLESWINLLAEGTNSAPSSTLAEGKSTSSRPR